MKKNTNTLNYFNIQLKDEDIRIIVIILIILVIILLFRKKFSNFIERILIFTIIFLLLLLITKNLIVTFIGTALIFLLINLIIKYRNTIENFESLNIDPSTIKDEPIFDKNIFETDDFKKSTEGIQELLKKVNGGIELKDDDIKETDILNIDVNKYSDDKKPNALKDAQKETYELINTVNALKDTITTLAPVLQEGKKLMNIFENLKL